MKTKWFPLQARATKRANKLSIIFLKFIDFEPSKISEVNLKMKNSQVVTT